MLKRQRLIIIQGLAASLVFLLTLLWGSGTRAAGMPQLKFYFFHPDSSQGNLGHLKTDMDGLFSRFDVPIAFQPFSHLVDFHQQVCSHHPAFLFLPRWYVNKYGPAYGLQPFLMPVRSGSTFYRKVLMAHNNSKVQPGDLNGRSLAMTSMGPDSAAILNQILFLPNGLGETRPDIVFVPKDYDALFALVLHQVDTALVTRETLRRIADVNPKILSFIHPLVETAPISMPVMCYRAGSVSEFDLTRFKNVFINDSDNHDLNHIMEMLNIDDWKEFQD